MRRNFNLSGIGLGLYLLGLGIGYIIQQSGGLNILRFWSGLYPILIILMGLDFILAHSERTAHIFMKPSGLVVAVIVIITVVGLINGFTSHLWRDISEFGEFREFDQLHGFNQRHFDWHHRQQSLIQQDFKLPSGITTVKIENKFGNIQVDTAVNETISAKATVFKHFFRQQSNPTPFKFTGEVQDRTFLVTLQRPQRLGLNDIEKRYLNADISINIPKGLSVAVKNNAGNVEVATVDGDLDIDMSAGNLEIRKVSRTLTVHNKLGTVNVGEVYGDANIISRSGQIKVEKIFGSSHIENAFGELVIKECYGPVTAKLEAGNLNLKLAKVSGNCDIDMKMGNIDLGLPAEAKFTLDSECLMGEIHSDFDIANKKEFAKASAAGTVNGGGPSVTIRSKSGNIRLYKL